MSVISTTEFTLGYLTLPVASAAGLFGLVGLDPAEGNDLRIERAVERGGEGRHLAPVGIAA
jgi:hypothetical protein